MTTNFPEKDAAPLIPALDDSTGWGSAVAMERCDVTKLLLLMFMQKLCGIVGPDAVIINAVDPGFTQRTGLFRSLSLPVKVACWLPYKLFAAFPEKGAWAYIDAAVVRGEETHGSFLSHWQISSRVLHLASSSILYLCAKS